MAKTTRTSRRTQSLALTSMLVASAAVMLLAGCHRPSAVATDQIDGEYRTDMNKCGALLGSWRSDCEKSAAQAYRRRHGGQNPPAI